MIGNREDPKRTGITGRAKLRACCDICLYYDWDDDLEENVCMMRLDEDEYARYMAGNYRSCPYFRAYDEYKSVQKQN